jgi:hypothetical protein
MSLTKAYKATRILESLTNYAISTNTKATIKTKAKSAEVKRFHDDRHFWTAVLKNPGAYWEKKIQFSRMVISSWVPRIPGLYFSKTSAAFRHIIDDDIDVITDNRVELFPDAKSRTVIGGIGTLLLPPDEEGRRLVSLSAFQNASTGIPALIYPEVWEGLKLRQGKVIEIVDCTWQPMSVNWSQRFASTKNIPRGWLILNKPEKLKVFNTSSPVIYHPFGLMEYEKDDALLYDYVSVTADSTAKSGKSRVEAFFKSYAAKQGRNGRYLTNPNLVDPLFDAQYTFPSEMNDPSEKAKLELLHRRITAPSFTLLTLKEMIQVIPRYYSSASSIRTLARAIGVSVARLKDDSAANMAAQLINYCIETSKMDALTDRVVFDYPETITK